MIAKVFPYQPRNLFTIKAADRDYAGAADAMTL